MRDLYNQADFKLLKLKLKAGLAPVAVSVFKDLLTPSWEHFTPTMITRQSMTGDWCVILLRGQHGMMLPICYEEHNPMEQPSILATLGQSLGHGAPSMTSFSKWEMSGLLSTR